MKLVMTVTLPGDWECPGCTEHIPIECDSPEQLIVDLDDKLKAWQAEWKLRPQIAVKRRRETSDLVRKHNGRGTELAIQNSFLAGLKEIEDRYPELPNVVSLGGRNFDVDLFLRNNYRDIEFPTIRTLEQWFDDLSKS